MVSCNAHHLRELLFVHQQYDQTWPKRPALITIKEAVETAPATGSCIGAARITDFPGRAYGPAA